MIRKILILIILFLIPIFFIFGCRDEKESDVMVIEVWDFPRPIATVEPWRDALFREFEKKYNVKIEFTKLSWARGGQKLDVAVASGTYPDVGGSSMKPAYVIQGVLEPLDDFITDEERADIVPQALESVQFEENIYAFPWYSTMYLTILNLDVFKERGVEPPKDGIWHWDEFIDKMQQLTFDRTGDGKIDVYGIGFGIQPGTGESWGVMYSDGGRFFNEDLTQSTVDSPEMISGIQKLVDLEHKYKVALPNAGGLQPSSDVWNVFINPDKPLAATFQGQWAIMALKNRNRRIAQGDPEAVALNWQPINFMAAIQPIGDSDKITTASPGVGSYCVFRQEDPVKRELCIKLAKILSWSDEAQKILTHMGVLPVRYSIGNIYGDDPDYAILEKAFEHIIMPPFHPESSKMDQLIQRQIQEAMILRKSVPDAMQDAAHSVNSVLEQYHYERDAQRYYLGLKLTPRQTMTVISFFILGILLLACTVKLILQPQPIKLLKKHYWSYLFILPSILVFTFFMLMPVVYSILLAFQRFSVTGSSFVGLANFYKIFNDEVFINYAIPNTLFYTLIMVPNGILVSLILASVIYPLTAKTQIFFRSAYYLPGVISAVIMALVWKWIFDPTFGLFNQLLYGLLEGLEPYPLLYNFYTGFLSALPYLVSIFAACGVAFLIFQFFRSYLIKYKPLADWKEHIKYLTLPMIPVVYLCYTWVYIPLIRSIGPMCLQIQTGKVGWLTDPDIALLSIMLSGMLMAPGGGVILYLAAMGRVPRELHECAMLDGAGPIRCWWSITVPLLKPTTLYLLVIGTIFSFQIFDKILIMTNGGPGYASTPLVMSIYRTGFEYFEFGVASAQALVLFAMVVFVSVLQFRFLRSDVEY